jgi:hypothetical protein
VGLSQEIQETKSSTYTLGFGSAFQVRQCSSQPFSPGHFSCFNCEFRIVTAACIITNPRSVQPHADRNPRMTVPLRHCAIAINLKPRLRAYSSALF